MDAGVCEVGDNMCGDGGYGVQDVSNPGGRPRRRWMSSRRFLECVGRDPESVRYFVNEREHGRESEVEDTSDRDCT